MGQYVPRQDDKKTRMLLKVQPRQMQTDSAEQQRALRSAFGRYPTGVTIVTVPGADGNVHCMTVNSFVSLSLDPPLVMWALRNSSARYDMLSSGDRFGLSVLSESQVEVARRHSSSPPVLQPLAEWPQMLDDCPVIAGAVAQFACRLSMQMPQGDHVLLVGEVKQLVQNEGEPLLFMSGRFYSAMGLKPL